MVSDRVCHFGGSIFFPPLTLFPILLQEEDKQMKGPCWVMSKDVKPSM